MFFSRNKPRIAFHTAPWAKSALAGIDLGESVAVNSRSRLEFFLREWLTLATGDDLSLLGSGRTAIALGLKALSDLDPTRVTVVIPSYACQALLNSVLAAGLTPKFIDTTDELISTAAQYTEAATSDVLCVILVNLCGKRLSRQDHESTLLTLRNRGIFSMEDNCQDFSASGSTIRSDMECYSLGFSKTLRATAGGVLVARTAVLQVRDRVRAYSKQPADHSASRLNYYLATYGTSSGAVAPELILSFRNSRSEYGTVHFSELDCYLASIEAPRLRFNEQNRQAISSVIVAALSKFPDLYHCQGTARNSFTRLPVILPSEDRAAKFWSHMNARGIELEGMYQPLHVVHGSQFNLPISERIHKLVYNVPNRPDLSKSETKRIVKALNEFGNGFAT